MRGGVSPAVRRGARRQETGDRSRAHLTNSAALALAVLLLWLLAGCGSPQPPSPELALVLPATATPVTAPATPEEQAYAAVAAELEAVKQQDIDALAALWLPDCSVTDANHTPRDATDDRQWRGWGEVSRRYVGEVFPFLAEPVAVPRPHLEEPRVTVSGDQAEVIIPGPDGRTAQDRWTLIRVEGGWRIRSLTFNLLPLP